MAIRTLLYAALWAPSAVVSFVPGNIRLASTFSRPPTTATTTMRSAPESSSFAVSRGDLLKQAGLAAAGVVSAAALAADGSSSGGLLLAQPAVASDTLAAAKVSYFRYVPRIVEAMGWYQGDLQNAVNAQDWPRVLSYFELVNTAGPDSRRPEIYQATSSKLERELYRPLTVWAQSFAIKGQGPKLKAMLEQEETLEKSMKTLEKMAKGKGLKEGQSREKEAKAAWTAGRDALKTYIDVANNGMVRSLNKVETPF